MNCYKFRDSISLYIDKELSIKDINRFNHHLETCSSCRVLFQGTLNVVSSMKKIPSVTVSADFGNRLQNCIIREQSRKETHRRIAPVESLGLKPRYAVVSVSALIAILVISVSFFTGGNDAPALFTREVVPQEETESHIPASSLAERSRADSSSNKMPVVSSHPQIPENQVRQVSGK
jgi:anti-sigma factor RsiW